MKMNENLAGLGSGMPMKSGMKSGAKKKMTSRSTSMSPQSMPAQTSMMPARRGGMKKAK